MAFAGLSTITSCLPAAEGVLKFEVFFDVFFLVVVVFFIEAAFLVVAAFFVALALLEVAFDALALVAFLRVAAFFLAGPESTTAPKGKVSDELLEFFEAKRNLGWGR